MSGRGNGPTALVARGGGCVGRPARGAFARLTNSNQTISTCHCAGGGGGKELVLPGGPARTERRGDEIRPNGPRPLIRMMPDQP